MDPAMQAHLMMMMASQQLIADAQRQRVQHQEEELKRQQAMDAMAKELEQDAVIRPNFDRFDTSNSTGGSDGTITAEEFRQAIDEGFHCSASGHVFTLSHARMMIRMVDADANKALNYSEFRFLWIAVSSWTNYFLTACQGSGATHPLLGPLMPNHIFVEVLRGQLMAMRMPLDGSDAQVRGKVDACCDLVLDSVRGSEAGQLAAQSMGSYVTVSDYYTVQTSLVLVSKFSCDGLGLTMLDMLRFSFYVRG